MYTKFSVYKFIPGKWEQRGGRLTHGWTLEYQLFIYILAYQQYK